MSNIADRLVKTHVFHQGGCTSEFDVVNWEASVIEDGVRYCPFCGEELDGNEVSVQVVEDEEEIDDTEEED